MGTEVGVSVVVHGDIGTFEKEVQLNIKNAIKAMADATVQRAQMLRNGNAVPVRSGALQSTGLVEPRGEYTYIAQFGNGLKYGRYQEFGPDGSNYKGHKVIGKDGKVTYEKKLVWDYTTEGTGPHYLKTAGDSVKKEGIKNYL